MNYSTSIRVERALSNVIEFCALMHLVRSTNFPGWWEGSANQCHPVGFVRGIYRFHDTWYTHKYCGIDVAEKGWKLDHWPDPIGKCTTIWTDGQWHECFRKAAEPEVVSILRELEEHICGFSARQRESYAKLN